MIRFLPKDLKLRKAALAFLLMMLASAPTWAEVETAGTAIATSYVDADGKLHENVQAVPLDETMTTLEAGTYVVNSDVNYTSQVTLNGDVNLILSDGKTMKITALSQNGIRVSDGSLTIYGQADGTGSIAIDVTTSESKNAPNGIYANDLTVNGGIINIVAHDTTGATFDGIQSYGIYAENSVTISGGQITSSGYVGIYASNGEIILGCNKNTDFINVTGYKGSVKIADRQALGYSTNVYIGTLTDDHISAIAGKTLVPGCVAHWQADADHDGSTAEKAYVISTTTGLNMLAQLVNSGNSYQNKYFQLGGDITYKHKAANEEGADTENNFTAIGRQAEFFQGHFDGNGKTIRGIRICKDDMCQGLFGNIYGNSDAIAEIKNVVLADAIITGGNSTGSIVGNNEGGLIENCHIGSDVTVRTVDDYVYCHGGIVGRNANTGETIYGIVRECTTAASITTSTGCDYFGGIVGSNYGIVSNSLYLGTDTSIDAVAGEYGNGGTVTNCGIARAIILGDDITASGTKSDNLAGISYNSKYYTIEDATIILNYGGTIPEGYILGGYSVKNADNNDVEVSKNEGVYQFTMPAGDVTVSATFYPLSGYCGRSDVNDGKDVTWAVTDTDHNGSYETLTISGVGEIDGYSHDDQPWTVYKSEITSAVIEEGVTIIGSKILYQYPALTSISIASSVTLIRDGAFRGCTNLATVIGGSGITQLAKANFEDSAWEKNLPEGLTYLGHVAYRFKGNETSITLDEKTTQIGYESFRNSKITSIDIPASVTDIDDYAFVNSAVATAVIRGDVSRIGMGAFSHSSLDTIVIHGSVISIGDYAFATPRLKKIYFLSTSAPHSAQSRTFEGCHPKVFVPAEAYMSYVTSPLTGNTSLNGNYFVKGYTVTSGTGISAASTDNGPLLAKGETVSLSLTDGVPASYIFEGYCVKEANGNNVEVSKNENAYQFTMPESNVTVSAMFTPDIATHWQADENRDGSTADKAYIITTPAGLNLLASEVNSGNSYKDKYFMLGDNITYAHTTDWNDATSTENNYTAIGDNNKIFKGHFDGNGKTVRGIRIYKSGKTIGDDYYLGVFGFIQNTGEVKNVILADARITGLSCVGGIVGASDGGPISNCHVLSDVTIHAGGYGAVTQGGIAGTTSGNITGCTSAASIIGNNYVGGIVGYNCGIVSNSLYLGSSIIGRESVGAIVGENIARGTIQNCYYTDTNIRGKDDNGHQLDLDVSVVGNNEGTVTNSGLAYSIALGPNISIAGDQTVYNVSGLTTYGNEVMSYDDGNTTTYYSREGSTVTLSYSTVPEGYTLSYKVKDAYDNLIDVSESENVYSFTMPNKNVNVSPKFTRNTTIDVEVYNANYMKSGDDANVVVMMTPEDFNGIAAVTISDGVYPKLYNVAVVNGEGRYVITNLANNTYNVTASFAGDDNYTASSTSSDINFYVPKITTGLDISLDSETINVGEKATVSITLNQTGRTNKEGGVTTITPEQLRTNNVATLRLVPDNEEFTSAGYATIALVDGKGTFDLIGLAAGKYKLKVDYSGNDEYVNSNSSVLTLIVNKNPTTVGVEVEAPVIAKEVSE